MNLDESHEIPTMTFQESIKFPLEHEEAMKIYNTNSNIVLELLNITFFSQDNKKYNCIGQKNKNSKEIIYIYVKITPKFVIGIEQKYKWIPLEKSIFVKLLINNIFEFLFEKFLKKYNLQLNKAVYNGWQWALASQGLQLDIIDADTYEINDLKECEDCDKNISKNKS